MEDLSVIVAANLVHLRNARGWKQSELAAMVNYSDKSVSKWERAESLPDVAVIKRLAEAFGVSVDYLLSSHDQWEGSRKAEPPRLPFSPMMVIYTALAGVFTMTMLLFVIFWIKGQVYWPILMTGAAVALITLLVLNSLWNRRQGNVWIVVTLVLVIFGIIYYLLAAYHPWQLILVLLPAEAIVIFAFRIRKELENPVKQPDSTGSRAGR